MKGEQWEEYLTKDYHSDEEWVKASQSAMYWCSCAVGVLVLGENVVKDPLKELSELELREKNDYVKEIVTNEKCLNLGNKFNLAIFSNRLDEARDIWNEIMEFQNE